MAGDACGGDFHTLTGEVIRGWAMLELALARWLRPLLTIDELRARMIWDSYGDFRGKIGLLRTLTRNFADEDLWSEATGIFDAVEAIAVDRYVLPHAFGEVDAAGGKLTFHSERADADGVVDFTRERSVDCDRLRDWLALIDGTRQRAAAFGDSLAGCVHGESLASRRAGQGASAS